MNSFSLFNFLSHFLFKLFRRCNFGDFILNHWFYVTGVLSCEKALSSASFASFFSFFVNFCTITFVALDHLSVWIFRNSGSFRLQTRSCRIDLIIKHFVIVFILNHILSFHDSLSWKPSNRWSEILWNARKTLIKQISQSLVCNLIAMT
jgi:hypothetical protein